MKKRRNHSPKLKAKVAVAAMKGDRTLVELAEQFDVHPDHPGLKARVVSEAEHLFENGHRGRKEPETEVKELHAKIGQLTMGEGFFIREARSIGRKERKAMRSTGQIPCRSPNSAGFSMFAVPRSSASPSRLLTGSWS